jgi:ChrR-like protein with cupin domain
MAIILKPGEYEWKTTPGGTGWSLLRHDRAAESQTRLLRYAPTTVVPAARLDHTVQWLVTRGEARCGDMTLRRGAYCCWPLGQQRPAVHPGEEGYTVLSVVHGLCSPTRLRPRTITDVDSIAWEAPPLGADDDAGALHTPVETRSLNWDAATGEGARLWRLPPGMPLRLGPASRLQEFYVLQGSLRWEGERIPIASYLAFAPGDDRGALEADGGSGSVLFVYMHGAADDVMM